MNLTAEQVILLRAFLAAQTWEEAKRVSAQMDAAGYAEGYEIGGHYDRADPRRCLVALPPDVMAALAAAPARAPQVSLPPAGTRPSLPLTRAAPALAPAPPTPEPTEEERLTAAGWRFFPSHREADGQLLPDRWEAPAPAEAFKC